MTPEAKGRQLVHAYLLTLLIAPFLVGWLAGPAAIMPTALGIFVGGALFLALFGR